jgi:hypothetical protein
MLSKHYGIIFLPYNFCAEPDILVFLLPAFHHFRIRLRGLGGGSHPATGVVSHFPYYDASGITPFAFERKNIACSFFYSFGQIILSESFVR